jgi:hypothetical protein
MVVCFGYGTKANDFIIYIFYVSPILSLPASVNWWEKFVRQFITPTLNNIRLPSFFFLSFNFSISLFFTSWRVRSKDWSRFYAPSAKTKLRIFWNKAAARPTSWCEGEWWMLDLHEECIFYYLHLCVCILPTITCRVMPVMKTIYNTSTFCQ